MQDASEIQSKPMIELDKTQDNSYWLQMWRLAQTDGFHQKQVNLLLQRFWHCLALKKHSRVLVPLCGKSLDMIWLAKQGCTVIGIELSPVAVKAFFKENHLKAKKTRHGNFTRWESGTISIWCGDYFLLNRLQLGHIDCVFDRASLTALPADIRGQYIDQLRLLVGKEAHIFLLTTEDIDKSNEVECLHIDQEIFELYRAFFAIELTHVERLSNKDSVSNHSSYYTDHKVYRLLPHIEPLL